MKLSDWQLLTIDDVTSKVQYGYTTKASDKGSVKFLRTTDITSGNLNWDTVPYCETPPDNVDKYLLKEDDILISRAGSVGYSYLVKNPVPAVFASYLIRFVPKIDARYISYFLQSSEYWAQISEQKLGIAVQNVNATKLKNVKIPVPNDPQERNRIISKIEELFSEINETIRSLQHTQKLLRTYREAFLYKQYSAFEKKVKVGSVVDMISGNAFKKAEYSASGVRLFQIANVSFGKTKWEAVEHLPSRYLEEYPQLRLDAGDIVMALNRPLLNDRLKVTELSQSDVPAILYQRVGKFIFDDSVIHPRFLLYFFRSPVFVHWLKEQLQGVNIPFINKSKLMGCELLPLPDLPTQIELVNKIDEEFSRIDALEAEIIIAVERAELIRQSILSKAFKGDLL